MSVLGAILQSNEAFMKRLDLLRPDQFYRDAHRKIFAATTLLSVVTNPGGVCCNHLSLYIEG